MFQQGLLNTQDENDKRFKESQLSFLPVAPLQEKLAIENPELTSRELEIMHMTLTGFNIQEIAAKIFRSSALVKWRLGSVYEKFGVKNRLGLIKKAAKTGLQFKTENGISQTFHLAFNSKDHKKDE